MSLKEWIAWLKLFVKERYVNVVLCALCVFLFPDYTAPVFAILALLIAIGGARESGSSCKNTGAQATDFTGAQATDFTGAQATDFTGAQATGFTGAQATGETSISTADSKRERRAHLADIFRPSGLGACIFIFIADVAVSIIYSTHKISSLLTLLMWLSMISIIFALKAVIKTNDQFRRTTQLIALTVGILGAIGCVQYFLCAVIGVDGKFLHFWCLLDDLVSKIYPLRSYDDDLRVASTFMNPNIFAEVMVCLIPICYYAVGKAGHEGTRNLFIGCIVIGVVGTAFSFSRMSYVCFLVMLVLTLIFILPRFNRHQGMLLIFVVVLGLMFLFFTPNIFLDRIQTLHRGDASIGDHFKEWGIAIKAFLNSPIIGHGAGVENTHEIMSNAKLNVLHSHNLYLELLVEGGLVALFAFALPVAKYMKDQVGTLFFKRKNNLLGFCLASSMIMFLIFGLTDFPILTPGLVGSFAMLLALSDISMSIYRDVPSGELKKFARFR